MKNNLIIAAAGSGKTSFLISEALKEKDNRILITTYTQANEYEIRKKIISANKYIPENIVIQTWFSFLIKHGVKPFQGYLTNQKITGLILVNSQSGLKAMNRFGKPIYFNEEKEFDKHYFSNSFKIYSDKLSKFVVKCEEKSSGSVIDRLSRIYSKIFVDEVQDLAGYDLELMKLLFKSKIKTLLVGDPRQGTYSTNSSAKNKKFGKSKIVYFFEDDISSIEIDDTSLVINYRSIPSICDLSNQLFPTFPITTSGNTNCTEHDGVFLVDISEVDSYLKKFNPVQLRDSRKVTVNNEFESMNFGESKGLSFDRVLIYPTNPFVEWLKNRKFELAPTSRSKMYVAITRARYSVGIVFDFKDKTEISGVTRYVCLQTEHKI